MRLIVISQTWSTTLSFFLSGRFKTACLPCLPVVVIEKSNLCLICLSDSKTYRRWLMVSLLTYQSLRYGLSLRELCWSSAALSLSSVFWFRFKAKANLSAAWPFAADHRLSQSRITFSSKGELFMRWLRQFFSIVLKALICCFHFKGNMQRSKTFTVSAGKRHVVYCCKYPWCMKGSLFTYTDVVDGTVLSQCWSR